MNKDYLLFFFLISVSIQAQIVDIPDANFKQRLLLADCVDTDGDGIFDSDADLNDDGEIQVSEAEAVVSLNVSTGGINTLEGIQYFTNLEILFCEHNILSSLDLSLNTQLNWLDCRENELSDLLLPQNQLIEYLDCGANQLTQLDVSGYPNLITLGCYENQLPSLDLTQNPDLEILVVYNNLISNIDVTQNPNLEWIWCFSNQISELDLTQNPNLEMLNCSFNSITSLDVSGSPFLRDVVCNDNNLNYLNVENGNNINFFRMLAFNNPNLNCIQVDDTNFSNNEPCNNNSSGWCKDDIAEYSDECILSISGIGKSDFALYPNPVQSTLTIATDFPFESLSIYSLDGQLIRRTSNPEVDVSNLPSGIYFVSLSLDGQTITKKFVKL